VLGRKGTPQKFVYHLLTEGAAGLVAIIAAISPPVADAAAGLEEEAELALAPAAPAVLDALPVAFAAPEVATELEAFEAPPAPAAPAAFGGLEVAAVLVPEVFEAPVAFTALELATLEAPDAPDLIGFGVAIPPIALDADEAALLFNGKASTAVFPIRDIANAMARNFMVNRCGARPAAQNCGCKECPKESYRT
jgi:hypothetical protein